jgi:predicted molibdopterin-dependent oxidoreductase YjgC
MTGAASSLHRVSAPLGRPVRIVLDGAEVEAHEGESLLLAVLARARRLRLHEATGEPRAGFCLMGACQDCWVLLGDGGRVRACTTPVRDGMVVRTAPAEGGGG